MRETVLLLTSMAVLVVSKDKCLHTLDKGVRWTIDCSYMNLSVTPPPVILHPVVTLNISSNNFVQLVDSQFVNWTDILHLDLSSNSIKTINAGSFKGLVNLIELNLMNNQIEFLSSNITDSLVKLRILNLSSNRLKKIYPRSFEPIPLLLKLFLKNNLELGKILTNYDDLEVSFNQGLITLDFSNTSLSEIPENFFSNNGTHLISLNIALNPIKNIPHLAHSLRSLNISGTLIETVPQELFSNSDLLEKLYLQGLPFLKDIKARALNGLSHLEEIVIKDCPKLSFISEDSFGDSSPKLIRVVISECALTTLPKTFMPVLNKVTHLDLQGNPWVCDGRTAWITNLDIPVNLTGNLRCVFIFIFNYNIYCVSVQTLECTTLLLVILI